MKNYLKTFLMLAIFLGVVFSFNSCNQADEPKVDFVTKTTIKDYINVLSVLSLSTVEEITTGDEETTKSAEIWDCLNVTVHSNETDEFFPRSWTLDYGPENCECFLGISRRGEIHVTLSDWWRNEGSYREVTFEDFYFNNNKLVGVKTYLNTGLNDRGNLTITKTVADAQLSYGDTGTMSWNSEKYSELIEGSETFKFADDAWSVTGSGSGVNVDNKEFTFAIKSALIYKNGCYYPVSGTIEFTIPNEETVIIDYGSGECDDVATTKVGEGDATEINL